MFKYIALLLIPFFASSATLHSESNVSEGEQNYFAPLTQQEKESISYIITTLSTKSMVTLLAYRKQLESAGAKTKGVNPLRFWKEVLTNRQLKNGLPHIGAVPKRQLINDFAVSFSEANRRGKIDEKAIDDFSKSTGIDKNLVIKYSKEGKWKQLLHHFFS